MKDVVLNLTENIVVRVLVVLLNSSLRKSICESIPDTKLFCIIFQIVDKLLL